MIGDLENRKSAAGATSNIKIATPSGAACQAASLSASGSTVRPSRVDPDAAARSGPITTYDAQDVLLGQKSKATSTQSYQTASNGSEPTTGAPLSVSISRDNVNVDSTVAATPSSSSFGFFGSSSDRSRNTVWSSEVVLTRRRGQFGLAETRLAPSKLENDSAETSKTSTEGRPEATAGTDDADDGSRATLASAFRTDSRDGDEGEENEDSEFSMVHWDLPRRLRLEEYPQIVENPVSPKYDALRNKTRKPPSALDETDLENVVEVEDGLRASNRKRNASASSGEAALQEDQQNSVSAMARSSGVSLQTALLFEDDYFQQIQADAGEARTENVDRDLSQIYFSSHSRETLEEPDSEGTAVVEGTSPSSWRSWAALFSGSFVSSRPTTSQRSRRLSLSAIPATSSGLSPKVRRDGEVEERSPTERTANQPRAVSPSLAINREGISYRGTGIVTVDDFLLPGSTSQNGRANTGSKSEQDLSQVRRNEQDGNRMRSRDSDNDAATILVLGRKNAGTVSDLSTEVDHGFLVLDSGNSTTRQELAESVATACMRRAIALRVAAASAADFCAYARILQESGSLSTVDVDQPGTRRIVEGASSPREASSASLDNEGRPQNAQKMASAISPSISSSSSSSLAPQTTPLYVYGLPAERALTTLWETQPPALKKRMLEAKFRVQESCMLKGPWTRLDEDLAREVLSIISEIAREREGTIDSPWLKLHCLDFLAASYRRQLLSLVQKMTEQKHNRGAKDTLSKDALSSPSRRRIDELFSNHRKLWERSQILLDYVFRTNRDFLRAQGCTNDMRTELLLKQGRIATLQVRLQAETTEDEIIDPALFDALLELLIGFLSARRHVRDRTGAITAYAPAARVTTAS
ncbi:unnamed protein product [Amoebophrya sp. A25]|nr:unnamed protein product [Amoebophrya sp. A25]|eukprot:GSA25T00001002001.1